MRSIAERGRRTATTFTAALAAGALLVSACSGDDGSPTGAPSPSASAGGEASTSIDGQDPSTPSTDPATTTTTEPPTTTTTLALITKKAVVKVANAAGVPGAAGRFTQVLQSVGFAVETATDAAGNEKRIDVSRVYYLPEARKAAERLAEIMGVEATPMPTPVPILEANYALGSSTIVVMLGKDLADEPIKGLTDR